MPYLVHILLRILAGIAGALLLYVAFFLYEDEEARIQNRLEQIWKRIDALQSSAMSKEVAFLQGATRTTSAILDRLLGHKLLSAQSIAVSMAFSLGSYLLCYWFRLVELMPSSDYILPLGIVVLLLFALGSLPAFTSGRGTAFRVLQSFTEKWPYYFGMMIFVIWATWWTTGMSAPLNILLAASFIILAVVIFGVLMDIFFIAFFRWVLRRISRFMSARTIIFCLFAVGAAVALLIGPVVAGRILYDRGYFDPHHLTAAMRVVMFSGFVSLTNLIEVLCLLLLIVVMLLLLAHRLVWPIIKRPIYAANRKQLIKNTKLLGAVGTALLMYAFPHNRCMQWITDHVPFLKG
jgi:hypothetical protein